MPLRVSLRLLDLKEVEGLNGRERFRAIMNFKSPDRLPLYEWLGYWDDTLSRWYSEGLPPGMSVEDYFGFDRIDTLPIDFDPIPRFVSRILEEDERYRVEVNETGIVTKALKTATSMPMFLSFPVENAEGLLKFRERFNPRDLRRYPLTWSPELIEYYRVTDRPVRLRYPGFFWMVRNLLGLPRLLTSFYREPRVLRAFFDFWADFLIETSEEALRDVTPDYVDFAEDMSYKNGPHISPRLFTEFIQPGYRKVTAFLRNLGVEVIAIDTDGDPTLLLPRLVEAGVNCLIPLEVAAGMDAGKLRKTWGEKLLLIGGVDKRALAQSPEAIQDELTLRFQAADEGGYIPCVDHNVSADISFTNFAYYVAQKRVKLVQR